MKTHVLLVDDNASRSAERRNHLVGAGVEIINACQRYQVVEVMKTHRVDIVCIDVDSVLNRGSEISAFIKCLKPFVPVVLIADDDRFLGHFEEHADIVIDGADFDITGRLLVQELTRDDFPFFRRWFDEWTDHASKSARDETIRAC